jgi:hypothetical protein
MWLCITFIIFHFLLTFIIFKNKNWWLFIRISFIFWSTYLELRI